MKIEYIRNLKASHMVIEQKKEPEVWEAEMIAHCRADTLLFGEKQQEDNRNMIWYDITGWQALEVILESREINHTLLCRFLMQLYEAAETLEAHLLLPDTLLLRPECIFTDYEMNRFCFCYYPGNEENFSQGFGNLMEYLLTRLDHKDEQAVEAAYGIHAKVVTEGAGLLKIGEFLRVPYIKEKGNSAEGQVLSEDEGSFEPLEETDESKFGRERQKQKGSGTIWQKITEKLKHFWGSGKPGKQRKSENTEESFVFEPEEEPETATSRPTVLLTQVPRAPEGILRYEGSSGYSDLTIESTPYVIGSEENCDGYIPSSTVSRRHARITRMDDIYFIEDLNSSNGTSVGGELLNYKVKMSLEKNEIIRFADEKYRFI